MKDLYPHPIIAREGWPFIIGGLLLSLVLSACSGWLALPFWLFTIFALQFFRDPPRPVPQVAIGDKVSASSTILARLPLSETAAPEAPVQSQGQAAAPVGPSAPVQAAPVAAAAAAPVAEAAQAAPVAETAASADAFAEQQVIEEAAAKVRAAAERETQS